MKNTSCWEKFISEVSFQKNCTTIPRIFFHILKTFLFLNTPHSCVAPPNDQYETCSHRTILFSIQSHHYRVHYDFLLAHVFHLKQNWLHFSSTVSVTPLIVPTGFNPKFCAEANWFFSLAVRCHQVEYRINSMIFNFVLIQDVEVLHRKIFTYTGGTIAIFSFKSFEFSVLDTINFENHRVWASQTV